jgi:hypothetical protein
LNQLFPPRLGSIIPVDSLEQLQTELDKQERNGKENSVHVKLYLRGKEALKRKGEWAKSQKINILLEEQELQVASRYC